MNGHPLVKVANVFYWVGPSIINGEGGLGKTMRKFGYFDAVFER